MTLQDRDNALTAKIDALFAENGKDYVISRHNHADLMREAFSIVMDEQKLLNNI